MQFFIDTANIEEIKELNKTGLIDGVTTNPSLVAKSDKPFIECIKEICSIITGPVSAEVTATESINIAIKGVVLVDSVDDSDDTVCEAIQRLQPDYFANGGDRGRSNTPEQQVCEDLGVKMLWSIGGDEKLQSSTELTKKDRDFSPPPVRTTSPHSER